jgi:hypothetical protein
MPRKSVRLDVVSDSMYNHVICFKVEIGRNEPVTCKAKKLQGQRYGMSRLDKRLKPYNVFLLNVCLLSMITWLCLSLLSVSLLSMFYSFIIEDYETLNSKILYFIS